MRTVSMESGTIARNFVFSSPPATLKASIIRASTRTRSPGADIVIRNGRSVRWWACRAIFHPSPLQSRAVHGSLAGNRQSGGRADLKRLARTQLHALSNDGLGEEAAENGWQQKAAELGEFLSSGFPVWVAVASAVALIRPESFFFVTPQFQFFGIIVTMLGMGMTMSLDDFQGAVAMPKELMAGVALQYIVMPSAGYFVSKLLQLPSHYAAGLILVSCCPGGTASNIVTYLARGNVALSVLMTAASTFMAVVMTPLLTARLVGQNVAVDAGALFKSTLQVVLLPVLAGALMNQFLPKLVRRISPFAPPVAVITVALICAGVIGQSAQAILSSGGQVLVAVALLHATGFLGGYVLSRLLGFDEPVSRTVSIEVGMQNSILGVVLAGKHFSNPLTAVPCAVSSVCHSIFGSALAGLWRLKPVDSTK